MHVIYMHVVVLKIFLVEIHQVIVEDLIAHAPFFASVSPPVKMIMIALGWVGIRKILPMVFVLEQKSACSA